MTQQGHRRSHAKVTIILSLCALGMFGFSFALIPLYDTFCRITGLQGKIDGRVRIVDTQKIDKSRTITVEFVTQVSKHAPLSFYPERSSIQLHPGELKRVNYILKNQRAAPIKTHAVPSVSPGQAALYLKKVECFCFKQQTVLGLNRVEMPLIFYIDKKLPVAVKRLSLSYTMYDVSTQS